MVVLVNQSGWGLGPSLFFLLSIILIILVLIHKTSELQKPTFSKRRTTKMSEEEKSKKFAEILKRDAQDRFQGL